MEENIAAADIYIYMYNSIKIHIICTLQVAYGMVLIPLRNWVTHPGEPHNGRLGQHPTVSHGYLYFLVGDIPSFGQWGYNGDEMGHPVICSETYPLVMPK